MISTNRNLTIDLKKYSRQIAAHFLLILFVFSNAAYSRTLLFREKSSVEKKYLPPVNQPRPRNIDVKNLAIDLRFDWKKKQAYGTVDITFAPLKPTDNISLDAGMLTINSVSSNGKNLKFEYDGGDKNNNLKIALDRIYAANENLTVKIDYCTNYANSFDPNNLGGNNGKGLRFNEPTVNDPMKMREIWSVGNAESNRFWFPSYDAPDDLRTTEFRATVDKNLTVISNGKLVETTNNADGTCTFYWKNDTPYANHLTSFVAGEFVNIKKIYEDIALNNFGYEREKDWVDASTERLPDMVKFFSETTGAKYPFQNYSQVFVQNIGTFASGSNVSAITENMADDFPTHADYFYLWDLTEAEALAAQWFGNYLTARDWSEAWLDKSFAHYFNCLYNEHRNGRDEWLLWVHKFDQSVYLNDWNSGIRRPIVTRNYENADSVISDNYATVRGALVLNVLRKQLGEKNWQKAIRQYVKSNAGKTVATEDFKKAVEDASGEKMVWFFDQWIYKMGHPIFEVTKNYDAVKKNLTLDVRQTQKADAADKYPQTEFFQGKIEIEIDGEIKQIWIKPQAENIFKLAFPSEPKFVNFDFESVWIKEIKFEKSLEELLAQLKNSKDALARQAAIGELANLYKDEKVSAEGKAKIKNDLREIASGRSYWRLRNSAMIQLASLSAPESLNDATIETLLTVIKTEKSWLRANAIAVLGNTRNAKYADLYLNFLTDESFRVINSAAIALGKTKDKRAFDALVKLKDKPSMKSQALLSSLAGLKELGDPRGFEIAFSALSDLNLPRWRLPTPPVWDYRVFAADTIASLGKSDQAFPLIFERFKKSLNEDDTEAVFNNIVLINRLADVRGQEAFEMLKAKYKNDANAMNAVSGYETEFRETVKNLSAKK